jgi:hypothetical protein
MKTRWPLAVALVVTFAGPLRAEKIPPEFRAPFEQRFWAGKTFAVVMQKGIPTMSIYGVRGDSTNAHYSIDVIGENWKASAGILDFDQTEDVAYLDLGEVMELNSISWKDNRVDLKLISVESKKVSRGSGFSRTTKREPVSTNFKFFFPFPKSKVMTAADVPTSLEFVQQFLQPFPNEAQARVYAAEIISGGARAASAPAPRPQPAPPARTQAAAPPPAAAPATKKEIKVGMTPLEVIDVLGRPQKELTFQNTNRWTYPDLTVIFENGKVKEVRF